MRNCKAVLRRFVGCLLVIYNVLPVKASDTLTEEYNSLDSVNPTTSQALFVDKNPPTIKNIRYHPYERNEFCNKKIEENLLENYLKIEKNYKVNENALQNNCKEFDGNMHVSDDVFSSDSSVSPYEENEYDNNLEINNETFVDQVISNIDIKYIKCALKDVTQNFIKIMQTEDENEGELTRLMNMELTKTNRKKPNKDNNSDNSSNIDQTNDSALNLMNVNFVSQTNTQSDEQSNSHHILHFVENELKNKTTLHNRLEQRDSVCENTSKGIIYDKNEQPCCSTVVTTATAATTITTNNNTNTNTNTNTPMIMLGNHFPGMFLGFQDDNDDLRFWSTLKSFEEQYQTKLKSFFSLIVPSLHSVHKIINEIPLNEVSSVDECLDRMHQDIPYLDSIVCNLTKYNKDRMNNAMRILSSRVVKFNTYSTIDSSLQNDPMKILDSSLFIKIYLNFVSSFSIRYLDIQKKHLRAMLSRTSEVLSEFPQSRGELIANLPNIRKMLGKLITYPTIHNSLYKSKNLFKMFFHIEDNLTQTKEMFEAAGKDLQNVTTEILKHFKREFLSLGRSKSLSLNILIKNRKIHEHSGSMSLITKLLSKLNEQQEELKTTLRNHFKDTNTLGSFIFLSISSLLFQRLLITLNRNDESYECITLYKWFLETYNNVFPLGTNPYNFESLSKDEQMTLLKAGDEISIILMKYLYLNIIKIVFMHISSKYNEFTDTFNASLILGIPFLEDDDLMNLKMFYKDSMELMEKLLEVLNILNMYRSLFRHYLIAYHLIDMKHYRIQSIYITLNKLIARFDQKGYSELLNEYECTFAIYKQLFDYVRTNI